MDGSLVGGRYRLLESHALGGMASIWRAADEQTGDIVAIKRLHPHLIADPGAKERLLREAASMEVVRHPNVVGIRGVIADHEPALVMDFVEGSSVADLLAEGRRSVRPRPWRSRQRPPTGLVPPTSRGSSIGT